MVAFTFALAAAAAIFGLSTAAPADPPSTGVIHRIFAGSTTANNGLHFEPENVVAQPGDLIEFHYLPKNHSVVQSSFAEPCKPLDGGVFSGFNFATKDGEAPNVFTFTVKDQNPFWYYCSQTVGNHCQMGMAGVINQNFNSPNTLTAYKNAAATTGVSISPPNSPNGSNGGSIVPNKPL